MWKWEEFDGVVCGCGWDALEWHTVLGGGTEGRGGESHYRQEHYVHSYIRDGEESKVCQDWIKRAALEGESGFRAALGDPTTCLTSRRRSFTNYYCRVLITPNTMVMRFTLQE